MSTPLVVLRCMKPMYSSTPTIMHPKKPLALAISAAAAPVVNSDHIQGDSFTKMYKQKAPPSVAKNPKLTIEPTECFTAARS